MKLNHQSRAPAPGTSAKPLLSVQDVAGRLSVSDKTVRRLIKGGALPTMAIGRNLRVSEEDLGIFLNRCR